MRVAIRPLGLVLVAVLSPTAGARADVDLLERLEHASVVLVGTLVDAEELTAAGVDYGRGVLRVEKLLYPSDSSADRLLVAQHKAFAFAIDPTGKWVYGYAHELATEELAAERALLECSKRAARTRVNAACRLYAVGDSIVWGDAE